MTAQVCNSNSAHHFTSPAHSTHEQPEAAEAAGAMGVPGVRSDSKIRSRDVKGTGHGLLNASEVSPRWKVALRHILMVLVNKLPGTRFKSRLIQRLFDVKMGCDVGIAYGVLLDPYDPSMISIGDNVIIGYESKIFVHMFTLNRQRIRPVTIGSNVLIGALCVIAPGVTIGDGASIAPGTIVNRNVPAGAIVTGNEMRIHKRNPSQKDTEK